MRLLGLLPDGWEIVCMDESIFIFDALVRRVWAIRGRRPIVLVRGRHRRTCVFGALTLRRKQLFRQYPAFNEETVLAFLRLIRRKFPQCYLFLDKARQHHHSRKVRTYLQHHRSTLRVRWFPTGTPELNAVEECWRQGKDALLSSRFYPDFTQLKTTITNYYRTKRFNLNIKKYLLRQETQYLTKLSYLV